MPLGSNSKSPLGFFKAVLGLGIPTNLHLPRLLLGGGHTQMILYIYIGILQIIQIKPGSQEWHLRLTRGV